VANGSAGAPASWRRRHATAHRYDGMDQARVRGSTLAAAGKRRGRPVRAWQWPDSRRQAHTSAWPTGFGGKSPDKWGSAEETVADRWAAQAPESTHH
jgi:hypothetical protein